MSAARRIQVSFFTFFGRRCSWPPQTTSCSLRRESQRIWLMKWFRSVSGGGECPPTERETQRGYIYGYNESVLARRLEQNTHLTLPPFDNGLFELVDWSQHDLDSLAFFVPEIRRSSGVFLNLSPTVFRWTFFPIPRWLPMLTPRSSFFSIFSSISLRASCHSRRERMQRASKQSYRQWFDQDA